MKVVMKVDNKFCGSDAYVATWASLQQPSQTAPSVVIVEMKKLDGMLT